MAEFVAPRADLNGWIDLSDSVETLVFSTECIHPTLNALSVWERLKAHDPANMGEEVISTGFNPNLEHCPIIL
jgi:hypothetical protein